MKRVTPLGLKFATLLSLVVMCSCSQQTPNSETVESPAPDAAFFSRLVPGAIDHGRIYLAIPNEERDETLVIYEGHFTRKDRTQYVAFFARHHKDAGDAGKWATYIVDSDFSLISVLARDTYLQITPDGIADVNRDGLDEIWSNDVGYEGTAYSLWFLANTNPAVSFRSVEWPYFGL